MDFAQDTWGTPAVVTNQQQQSLPINPRNNQHHQQQPNDGHYHQPPRYPTSHYNQQHNYGQTPSNYHHHNHPSHQLNSHVNQFNHGYFPQSQQQHRHFNHHHYQQSHGRGRGRGGMVSTQQPHFNINLQGRGNSRGGGYQQKRGRGRGNHHQQQQKMGCPSSTPGHKPWMTPELQETISEKNQAHEKALMTSDPDDWRIYKALRRETMLKLNDAKLLFQQKTENENPGSTGFYCDTCDKTFKAEELWNEHKAQHVVCKLDGCTFTAHPKILLKHIDMQHSGNLFSKIKGYETPEQIEKWKAERKNNYPTAENVIKKQEERAERMKRGERIPFQKKKPFSRMSSQSQRRGNTKNSSNFKKRTDNHNHSNRHTSFTKQTEPFDSSSVNNLQNHLDEEKSNNITSPKVFQKFGPREHELLSSASTNLSNNNISSSSSIIILENFYSQVRVVQNRDLIGKNLTVWDLKTQNLCQKVAQCGRPMSKVDLVDIQQQQCNDDDDQLENEHLIKSISCITDDEEEQEHEGEKVNKQDVKNNLNSSPIITSSSIVVSPLKMKPQTNVNSLNSQEKINNTELQKTDNSSSSSLLSGLVPYSSDSGSESDDERPEEMPTVSVKEEGEVLEVEADDKMDIHEAVVKSKNVKDEIPIKKPFKSSENNKKKDTSIPKRPMKRKTTPRMSRLLRMLLENDIRRERNQILQVCRFIRENNFFDDVATPEPENELL